MSYSDRDQLREDIDTAASEIERLRQALEWIRCQTGVSTCDDALRVMGEVFDAATLALGSCDRCEVPGIPTTYAPEYGANFCESCAADPQGVAE